MSCGFPTYSQSARKGEAGVNLVSKIVSDTLGWIFKRNHQEHDFGVDGQIEIVTDGGAVTGQIIATQIKYGTSFFQEKNKWGYVYRGKIKHFNYLSNYPTPVIAVICHPQSKQCYWARFDPEQAQVSSGGWKMTIPLASQLSDSRLALRQLVGPPVDRLAALKAYWELNQKITDSSFVLYVLDDVDVRTGDTSRARAFFDRLRKTKELAFASQGKIELSFSGYDSDPRELFEISEVKAYVAALDRALPELFFFIRTDGEAYALKVFVFCLCDASWEGTRATRSRPARLVFNKVPLVSFLDSHWRGLNELTDWLGMSAEENRSISYAVFKCLGLGYHKTR